MGLPNDTKEEREQARSDMEDIFGTQEVLAGQAPTGVEAGVALNLLAEQAFRRFGPVIKNWRRAFRKHEQRKLVLMKENYDEARQIEVAGDNEELETFHFSGADVGNTTDVFIEFDRGAAFSKAAQDQRILSAADKGYLGDTRRPDVAGKLLEKLEIDGFDSSYNLDAKKARRVLNILQEGEEPPPFLPQIDNTAVQLQVFKDFILTSEFEELPEATQKAIISRASEFLQIQQQQQQAAQQAAEAAKGSTENVSDSVVEAQPGQEAPTQELTAQQ